MSCSVGIFLHQNLGHVPPYITTCSHQLNVLTYAQMLAMYQSHLKLDGNILFVYEQCMTSVTIPPILTRNAYNKRRSNFRC